MKKIIALILSAVFCFAPFAHASAGEEVAQESAKSDCPYIFVHGFMGSDIYVDPDDPGSEKAWPPSGDRIKAAVKEGLPILGRFLITHNYDRLADELIPVVCEMFSPIFLTENGELDNKSGVRWSYPDPSEITPSSQLNFDYDWRLSPIETAGELNDFIDYVLECSGASQVLIQCHSYGGVVCTTYAKLYGTSKVKSWVFNSTAVYGETYNGELMTGQMRFDAQALTEYLKGAFSGNKNEKFLNFLMKTLYKTGVTGLACKIVNRLIDGIGMEKLSQGILPLFGRWYSIWSMIPDDMIDDAFNFVFNEVYGDDGVDRENLKANIRKFDTEIRPYKAEVLNEINETSNYYVLARYGFCSLFMTPSWRNLGDNTIDLKYASQGATAADYGSTLTDEYIAGKDARYISPDKTVDASTCSFPEQTWFVRGSTHNQGMGNLAQTLIYYDGQATVDTFEDLPRFMYYEDGNIYPDR